jgi:exonuclease VII large subunit
MDPISHFVSNVLRELGRNRTGFFRAVVSTLIVFGVALLWTGARSENLYFSLMPAMLVLSGLGFLMYDYLRVERTRYANILREENQQLIKSQEFDLAKATKEILEAVRTDMAKLANAVENDKKILFETFADAIAKKVNSAVAVELRAEARQIQFTRQSTLIRSRLETEIEALARRGRVNLTIGAFFAAFGIAALGYFALYFEYKSFDDVAIRFIPRLTFVILIELFSYFFLNLYRHSIFEIKYFQNELTNVESRLLALQGCLLTGDSKTTAKICDQLSRVERNFVLKRGESTIQDKELETLLSHEENFVKRIGGLLQARTSGRPR